MAEPTLEELQAEAARRGLVTSTESVMDAPGSSFDEFVKPDMIHPSTTQLNSLEVFDVLSQSNCSWQERWCFCYLVFSHWC